MNRMCGRKVSIVSAVPQTTRNRVRGILTTERGQLVFIDTPGYHLSQKKLNLYLTGIVGFAIEEADIVLYVVDGARSIGEEERALIAKLSTAGRPTVVALNKKDCAGGDWEEKKKALSGALPGAQCAEISALKGDAVPELVGMLFTLSPEGELWYPDEYYTDQTPDFRISEIVREKAVNLTRMEVPHALYVKLEDLEFRDEGKILWVRGFILVERESQKGILVGRNGGLIKRIVREAEADLGELFPYAVRLDMRVKVDKNWRKKDVLLRKMIF